ncbi:hypothetical protein [Amycolatopsis eburnea]|nr:hypothetical protein [Amycolatopsis eburnea]
MGPADLPRPFDARTWPGCQAAGLKYRASADLGEVLFNYWD